MKYVNRFFIVICSCLLIISVFPSDVSADTDNDVDDDEENQSTEGYASKDEVIYGKLDSNGQTNNMYVVNTFHETNKGTLIDHGPYTHVRNLTDLTDISMSDDKVELEGNGSEFYYQGQLEQQALPWDITIDYLLDGEKINPDELAGKSGEIEIRIRTKENDSVDPVFFNYYLQQISVTLDPEKFDNIQAPEGIKANEGKKQAITFSVMPEEESELIITADVEKFELDPIEINALPANIAMEDPDFGSLTGQFKTLSDAISDLHTGTEQLNSGISELNEGASELSNGSSEYREGIHSLDSQSDELTGGSKQIKDALGLINQKLNKDIDIPDLGNLEDIPDAMYEFAKSMHQAADGLRDLKEKYDDAISGLEEPLQKIDNLDLSDEEMQSLLEALEESDVNDETINKLKEMKEAVDEVNQALDDRKVLETLNDISERLGKLIKRIDGTANEVETTAKEVEKGLDEFDSEAGIEQIQDGIATLNKEYNAFHEGLLSYTNGVGELASSYDELDNGVQSLADNTPSLYEGSSELEEGTKELEDKTDDLPGDVESEINEKLEEFDFSDFEPVSFVSDKNEDIEVVQFVLQTDSIKIPEAETDDTEEKEEKESIWQRFLGLFGL